MLETDSLTLVKALQSEAYDRARGGMLFREANYIMAISFAPRSCNVDPVVWVCPLPDFANVLLVRDLTEPMMH